MHTGSEMKHLTVRNLPPEVARALAAERQRRGASLNQTVIDLLRQSLGVATPRRSNGLARLAGSWSAQDLDEFEAAVADTETIDDEMWR